MQVDRLVYASAYAVPDLHVFGCEPASSTMSLKIIAQASSEGIINTMGNDV